VAVFDLQQEYEQAVPNECGKEKGILN